MTVDSSEGVGDAGPVPPTVIAVSRDAEHRFSKTTTDVISLLAGLGVSGDTHAGATVQHRSRVAADPAQPNLRQVHLLHAELFDELEGSGFVVGPGQLGENITTRGLSLLGLPRGARLHIGSAAVVMVTGLRNPCQQISAFQPGLLKAVIARAEDGSLIRRAGIMGVVEVGGDVHPDDAIEVELPAGSRDPLEPV